MKNKSPIILVLLSVGLFYTFTNVEYKKVQSLSALASQYQDVLKNVSGITRLRDGLLIAYEEFPQEAIRRIEKVLPDNVDTVRLALELDSMASRYGIAIKNVRLGNDTNSSPLPILPENASSYEKAAVSFSFVSNYANLKRLLADMENNLRIMEVKSLSFQADDNGLYEHEVVVETYWLKK